MKERIQSVLDKMSSDGLDLLIAASTGLHTLDRPDPVAWLTGYRSIAESILLLHAGGDAKLIVSPPTDAERLATRYSSSPSLATDRLCDSVRDVITSQELSPPRRRSVFAPHRGARNRLYIYCNLSAPLSVTR